MNEEQGLSQQGLGAINTDMLQQVKALLAQGMSPEELVQQGVPMEIIEAAMMELSQEMQQQQMAAGEGRGLSQQQGLM